MAKHENLFGPGWDAGWTDDLPPIPAADAPTDLFMCALCRMPLPLVGVVAVEHDCATGQVTPVG